MTDEAREQSDETVPYRVICISLYHEDIERLAKSWDSTEEWLNDVRHSRAAKGSP